MTDQEFVTHVQPIDGKVIVTFPVSVTYLSMPPEKAREFVKLILDCATTIEAGAAARPPGTRPS